MNRLTLTKGSFLSKNMLVVFDYTSKKDGTRGTRSVVVAESTPTHIAGADLFRGGNYRKFLRNHINGDITVWGMLEKLPGTD